MSWLEIMLHVVTAVLLVFLIIDHSRLTAIKNKVVPRTLFLMNLTSSTWGLIATSFWTIEENVSEAKKPKAKKEAADILAKYLVSCYENPGVDNVPRVIKDRNGMLNPARVMALEFPEMKFSESLLAQEDWGKKQYNQLIREVSKGLIKMSDDMTDEVDGFLHFDDEEDEEKEKKK